MTVIAKNYYHDNGLVVTGMCIVCLNIHEKIARNSSCEIDLDEGLQVFLLEDSNSDIWEYLVSLYKWKILRICIQIVVSLSR